MEEEEEEEENEDEADKMERKESFLVRRIGERFHFSHGEFVEGLGLIKGHPSPKLVRSRFANDRDRIARAPSVAD